MKVCMKTAIATAVALIGLVAAPVLAQSSGAPPANRGTTPPANGAALPKDYRLVVGDKLRIEVYKDAQLSQSLEIRPDGKITLPLIGDVPAAGYTPSELAGTLTEKLREYVTTPVVTVIVAEANPPMIYVMGEVNQPGAQPLREPISVLQALAVAGGFRDFANTRKIRILRKMPNGSIQTINFNYRDAVERPGTPFLLQPGDTVIVP